MSTSSNSALALDLDGTLVDARARQVGVMRAVAEEAGARLDGERFWELKRNGRTSKRALVELGYPAAVAERLGDRWAALVEEPRYLRLDRLLPGVEGVLSRLAGDGCRPLILTARHRSEAALEQVRSLGLLRWCPRVCVVSPPAAAEEKAAQLRALGCRALIGDSESDARAAELAGVEFAAVTTGQRSPAFLRTRRVGPTCDSLEQALREVGWRVPELG